MNLIKLFFTPLYLKFGRYQVSRSWLVTDLHLDVDDFWFLKNAKWKVKNGKGTLPNAYRNLQANTGQNQL